MMIALIGKERLFLLWIVELNIIYNIQFSDTTIVDILDVEDLGTKKFIIICSRQHKETKKLD
jgi:hypothetical protein